MSAGRLRRLAPGIVLLVLGTAGCAAHRADPPPAAPDASPCPAPSPTVTPTATVTPIPSPTPTERAAARRRHVVLVGDSTTFGTPQQQSTARKVVLQSPYEPGAALEKLLTLEPPPSQGGTPWRDAQVHNLAIAGSSTELWLADPPRFCKTAYEGYPLVTKACRKKTSWVKSVPLAVDGAHIDVVIVDLGINDLLITHDPKETVARLIRIRDALAPTPVLFFPPIAPRSGPRGTWPKELRTEMVKQGLFDGKPYPAYVPTYDGLHPTDGGYAAKAALWLDALRRLP